MGSSGFIFQEEELVESTSLTELFEKYCPIYMSYGMSYNDFWYGKVDMVIAYRKAYKLKLQHQDENNWMLGMYVYDAINRCVPVLHPFSKSKKPLQYPDKPYLYDKLNDDNMNKQEKQISEEQRKENERLMFLVKMQNWMRATQKQFENKE